MIDRTTAEAALEAFQRTAAARREYGKPIDAALAAMGEHTKANYLLLGCYWLAVAGAETAQLDAAWHLSGADPLSRFVLSPLGSTAPNLAAAMRAGGEVLTGAGAGLVSVVRLALACLDQGDLFRRVTPARLVEVLCWEEQPS